MEKAGKILVALLALVIVGAAFVSADLSSEESQESSETGSREALAAQPICGPNTCNSQCRGGCGIPSCGCSR